MFTPSFVIVFAGVLGVCLCPFTDALDIFSRPFLFDAAFVEASKESMPSINGQGRT